MIVMRKAILLPRIHHSHHVVRLITPIYLRMTATLCLNALLGAELAIRLAFSPIAHRVVHADLSAHSRFRSPADDPTALGFDVLFSASGYARS
jgi:hypothetical protein